VTFIPKKNFKGDVKFTLQARDAGRELSSPVDTQVSVGEWVVVIDRGVRQGLSGWLCLSLFQLILCLSFTADI